MVKAPDDQVTLRPEPLVGKPGVVLLNVEVGDKPVCSPIRVDLLDADDRRRVAASLHRAASTISVDDYGRELNKLADDTARTLPRVGKPAADDDVPIIVPEWPAPPGPDAYVGLAGDIVRAVDPYTEADPVGVLLSLLAGFGNAVGRGPRFRVGADEHRCNSYVVLVGATAAGRKGTAVSAARKFLAAADPEWDADRVLSGLSSGEGITHAVRDAVEGGDAGVADKRLLALESEFGRALKCANREGNTLSAVLRAAWDCAPLGSLTRGTPHRATGAHVSLLGNITPEELRALLSASDAVNGLGNRILWPMVKRSKLLPDAPALPDDLVADLGHRLREAMEFARRTPELVRDADAGDLWRANYERLTTPPPGTLGAVTSRAAVQVLRLSMVCALMDRSPVIGVPHLRAAMELVDYCGRSAGCIFGAGTGNRVADEILRHLRTAGTAGLSRSEISTALGRNRPAEVIAAALGMLRTHGLAAPTIDPRPRGRPAERWREVATKYERNEVDETSPAPPTEARRDTSFLSSISCFVPPDGHPAPPADAVIGSELPEVFGDADALPIDGATDHTTTPAGRVEVGQWLRTKFRADDVLREDQVQPAARPAEPLVEV